MMAGRNLSASHVAFTSTRVMGTCSTVGQAVGTAAAMCCEYGLTPRDLYQRKDRLRELQQRLLRDDQTIRDVRSEEEVNKGNENLLLLGVVEKANKIEKLAKRIKGTARGN